MQKTKSILLLFILGIFLLPWQLVCGTHLFGHHHQHHDGPSPCELRAQYKGKNPVYWPPMDCRKLSVEKAAYQTPDKFQVKPDFRTLAVATVLFDLIILPQYERDYVPLPKPRNNSGPPLSVISLRGPPLV